MVNSKVATALQHNFAPYDLDSNSNNIREELASVTETLVSHLIAKSAARATLAKYNQNRAV